MIPAVWLRKPPWLSNEVLYYFIPCSQVRAECLQTFIHFLFSGKSYRKYIVPFHTCLSGTIISVYLWFISGLSAVHPPVVFGRTSFFEVTSTSRITVFSRIPLSSGNIRNSAYVYRYIRACNTILPSTGSAIAKKCICYNVIIFYHYFWCRRSFLSSQGRALPVKFHFFDRKNIRKSKQISRTRDIEITQSVDY